MLPRPAEVRVNDGVFTLEPATTLAADPALAGVAGWLRGVLGPATGCWLPPGDGGITLCLDDGLAAEGYLLAVTTDGVRIAGGDPAGVFYGAQTLRQLLPPTVFRRARTGS